MLRLAGQPLILPDARLISWIERVVPVADALPWAEPTWPGPTLAGPGVATATGMGMPRELKVGRFWWPTGASRWAYGNFLCSGDQFASIRAAFCGIDGDKSMPGPLEMWADGQASGEVLRCPVWLLRAMPLTQIPQSAGTSINNLYLLTCVCSRYFWQDIPCPPLSILGYGDPAPTPPATAPAWSDLVAAIAAVLPGVTLAGDGTATPGAATITADAVPDAYLDPDPSLGATGASAAMVLDAVAWNVSMKLVAKFDGTYRLMNYANSLAARQKDDTSGVGPLRSLRAGGDGYSDNL